ncbi:fibrillarin-like rRNA/tRNA 2'-O-methyltransferase [Candidatus Woesearchaeota archaeon]|jgi:fibrillarin-like pre-rRNA processing protein|nr:fibrillarin-like rRNA/tRNA 2'-O-methyltransferase [Candidatus Woesearchaeota archaeon]
MRPHKLFEIFQDRKRLYTKSLVKGKKFFEERTFRDKGIEYREFDPSRSKLAAMIAKGSTNIGIREGNIILYLGSSHGYTVSFVSDMVGKEGMIFGVDPAPRVMRDFMFLVNKRENIVPLLADANHPETYKELIPKADIVFQDIAQRNQADIFIRNCKLYLKEGGYGLLAVKARSIDITKKPNDIFIQVRKEIEKVFKVIDFKILEPYQKDHCMIIIKN